MKLRIFQSDKGDCILFETKDKHLVLCDGGMSVSMREHVRPKLGALRKAGRKIDFAYVSHIDQDHISGILQLLKDELEWRVFESHQRPGGADVKKPVIPRPPEIGGLWHNAFRDQINDNNGAIEDLLAAAVPALFATAVPELTEVARDLQKVAASIPEAIEVSKMASAELLDIPVNRIPGTNKPARLLMVREGQQSFPIGSSRWTIIGPTGEELKNLREGWNNWLDSPAGAAGVKRIREEIRKRIERFSTSSLLTDPFDLGSWNGIPDFKGVTAPNVASLMFLVEEDGKTVLLTGDSQQEIILKGLEQTGFLTPGFLHVDVLKVQHHGSENNLDADFARKVSADHYVFCGNGENGNPDPRILRHIFNSRLGPASKRALAPKAKDRRFTFWFSTSSSVLNPESKEHASFTKVEEVVADMKKQSGGLMKAFFNSRDVRVLSL
jgi:hypothetical protein